jgi:hypothetical protein
MVVEFEIVRQFFPNCASGHAGNRPSAFAEANRWQSGLLTVCAKRHAIAIFEEPSEFARGQPKRLRIAPELEQTTFRSGLGARDRASGEQISGAQIATVACVVREQLGKGPIKMAEIAAAN